jgi:hypothetical protein
MKAMDSTTNFAPDHRNEGFTAKSALYEESRTRAAMIDRHIMTKPGLPVYTNKELEQKGGEVISFNTRKPITFEEFESYPAAKKLAYLQAMDREWPGVSARALSLMMDGPYKYIAEVMKEAGVQRGKGKCPGFNREQFLREMCRHDEEPAVKTEEPIDYDVEVVEFACDAGTVGSVIKQFGIKGPVAVQIRPLSHKRRNDNGSV